MSKFNVVILFIFILLSFTFTLSHYQSIIADKESKNHRQLPNETYIGTRNPDPEILVSAFSNGEVLSSYTEPQKDDILIREGNWTMEKLSQVYPLVIEKMTSQDARKTFLIKDTVLIDSNAALDIIESNVFLKSLSTKDNNPVVLITYGKTNILNSRIMSWDPENKRPDPNPYHPRSFLVAKNGGQMNVIGSEISYLGFSLAGTHTLHSSIAALAYYNTSQFQISNSTLNNNLYGFYSKESSKFTITNNRIYANIKYGLDPHSGSKDFIIDSNHIFANGAQGIICSFRCQNVTVSNNIVEYNTEGIGLHWLTNSSTVKNNLVKYNGEYGIFVKTNSYKNIIVNNTVLGNGKGIGLFDNSNDNIIKLNVVRGNILQKNQIHQDENSLLNVVRDNTE